MNLRPRGWSACAVGMTAGALLLSLFNPASAATFTLKKKYIKPIPAEDDALGYSAAGVGSNPVIGVPYDDTAGVNAGAVYLFDGSTGKMVRSFLNPDAEDNDEFGWSVATDGSKLVVGALLDDRATTNAGAVYVFDTDTGDLLLSIPNPTPNGTDRFGHSVSIAGDYILVGAPWEFSDDRGTAHVFDSSTGSYLGALNPPGGAANDQFGFAVSTDGVNCLVGAPTRANGANGDAGTAFVFDCATGTLTTTLVLPSPNSDDELGRAVAISGNDCLVGSPYTDTGFAVDAGSAHLFNCTTGAIVASYIKTSPSPVSGDSLGFSVAFLGSTEVLAGAPADDNGSAGDSGAVVRFTKSTGAQVQRYSDPTPVGVDNVGHSLAVVGSNFVAGAPFDDQDQPQAGVAHIFNVATGAVIQTVRKPSHSFSFAFKVAGSSNVVAVTAGTIGEVYIFDPNLNGTAPTGQILRILRNPENGTNWGYSLAFLGDNLVLSHPYVQSPSGRVYVINSLDGSVIHTLTNPTPSSSDYFGWSVAAQGNAIIVGAPGDNSHLGKAYVYNATTGSLITSLSSPNATADQFGTSVAIFGNYCLVGTPYTDIGPDSNAGTADVYNCTTGAHICTFEDSDPHDDDQLGINVAFTSDGLAVAAANVSEETFIFDPATCAEQRLIENPSGGFDVFGDAVAALSGGDLAIGGPQDLTGQDGSAWVFDKINTTGNIHLTSDVPTNDAGFGNALGGVGADLIVGATWEGPPDMFTGKAYYFQSTPECGDGFVDAGEACDGQTCCNNATCQWATAGTTCTDDGNQCTFDTCDGAGVCEHPYKAAGTACTPDSNTCTKDECNGTGVCTHPNQPDGFGCNDNSMCTQTDVCSGGVCSGGNPLICNDNNECTTDSCVAATGCKFQNKSNGTSCDDGIACSQSSACTSGVCQPTACQTGSCSLPDCGGAGTCSIIGSDVKTCNCR